MLTQRLQSDPIGRRIQSVQAEEWRKIPGQPFGSQKNRKNSSMLFPIKGVDWWQEDLVTENEDVENFMSILEEHETDIYEVCLSDSSEEVARVIAGYIVRILQAKLKCFITRWSH